MNPSIHELAEQAEWEMEGVRRAVMRYEEAEAAADPMLLPPGKALMRGVVGPLIAAIREEAERCSDTLSKPGRQPTHAWLLQMVDPAKAAVITLSVACSEMRFNSDSLGGRPALASVAASALQVANGLRDQVEYDRWEAVEEQRNAEAQRSKVSKHENRLLALKRRYPNLDRRVWAKWRAKLDLAREKWTAADSIAIGTCLIGLLCKVAPDRFVISERPMSGGVQYFLDITTEVREVMHDVRERAMVSRPLLMPMICRPVPWAYSEAA